jgi:hypothetical protein
VPSSTTQPGTRFPCLQKVPVALKLKSPMLFCLFWVWGWNLSVLGIPIDDTKYVPNWSFLLCWIWLLCSRRLSIMNSICQSQEYRYHVLLGWQAWYRCSTERVNHALSLNSLILVTFVIRQAICRPHHSCVRFHVNINISIFSRWL